MVFLMPGLYEIGEDGQSRPDEASPEQTSYWSRHPNMQRAAAVIGVLSVALAGGAMIRRDNSDKQARFYKNQFQTLQSNQKRLHDDAYQQGALFGEANEEALRLSDELSAKDNSTDITVWLGVIERYKKGQWAAICKDPIVLPRYTNDLVPAVPEYNATAPLYYGVFRPSKDSETPVVIPATMQPGDRYVPDGSSYRGQAIGTYPVIVETRETNNTLPLTLGLLAVGADGHAITNKSGEITPGRVLS